VSWIRSLERQNASNVDFNDHFYRARLRSLQALDEIVDGIVTRLERYGILDSTYIIYTTDNGYHIGQHRLQPGKECGFEEDINIPLVIRGPKVPRGEVTDIVTSHTDLAPTIFSLIGAEPRADFDGAAIPVTETGLSEAKAKRHEHVNVEYWGFALTEGDYGKAVYWNNTYKALRILGKGYNLYYSVWCNNEHELYDLDVSHSRPDFFLNG
jgi:arylsulfatase A-like enzyme